MTFISQRNLKVEWGDCDPADIVYYPNYFAWFDASLMHHFERAGLPKKELLRRYDVLGWPMVDTRAVFHQSSTYGDEVMIETRISKFGRTSFEVEHRLFRHGPAGAHVLAVEGFEKHVLVGRDPDDPTRRRSVPVPAEVIALFQRQT